MDRSSERGQPMERDLGRPKPRGLPVGEFGFFASCLLAVALGLAGFCGSCFLAIVSLLVYNSAGGHSVNYADSYRYVALPVGVAVMVGSGLVLAVLWVRRQVRAAGRSGGGAFGA